MNQQLGKKYGLLDDGEEDGAGGDADDDDDDSESDDDNTKTSQYETVTQQRIRQLPLLTKEIVLASLVLNISLSLPHFNQFGFVPFQKDYYTQWLHEKQIIAINLPNENGERDESKKDAKYQIKGIDEHTGYLLAVDMSFEDYWNNPDAVVELYPDQHSFDMNTMTVKPKVDANRIKQQEQQAQQQVQQQEEDQKQTQEATQ